MDILFLGPECARIEEHLSSLGHLVERTEDEIGVEDLRGRSFEFCISYRYRHILRAEVIDLFRGRAINMHISYLPWNRGSDPNLWSFLEDTPKGASIHLLSEGLDRGDLLLQERMSFDSDAETLSSTYRALSDAIERMFIENSSALLSGAVDPYPQGPGGSYHRSRDKEPFLHLLAASAWDTPVRKLIGAAKKRSPGS